MLHATVIGRFAPQAKTTRNSSDQDIEVVASISNSHPELPRETRNSNVSPQQSPVSRPPVVNSPVPHSQHA